MGKAVRSLVTLPTSFQHSHQLSQPTIRTLHNTQSFRMPTYIVTCKEDCSDDQVAATKQHAKDNGGKITHEYKIIKGFAVEYPEGSVQTLENHEHVKAVEQDQTMKIS